VVYIPNFCIVYVRSIRMVLDDDGDVKKWDRGAYDMVIEEEQKKWKKKN